MDTTLLVLPSARAIRYEQLQLNSSNLFLPNYITMSDFLSKLCVVDDYIFIDDDTRTLLLLEASDFKAFSSLQIERNFFTFTKNSVYIFKFFAELSAELYDISNLVGADIYGEFEEHIRILAELYKRYEKLCKEKKYLDRIFLPYLYTFNAHYIQAYKKISLKVDGHLTNFEFELLEQCCLHTEVELLFSATQFNTKMQKKFLQLGVEVETGYIYTISFNTKSIQAKTLLTKKSKVFCESFSEPLLQVAFMKKKIYDFIQKGYAPEKIVVIVPDENMAEILKSFDEKSNLNLAMGESFKKSALYTKLQATTAMIELDSCENEARLERVGDALYTKLYSIYKKEAKEVDFIAFLQDIEALFFVKRELEIYKKELHSFKKLLPFMQDMRIKSLLNLFMQRLSSCTLDDIRGGKITVMGVLETRSMLFDGVIILDFDEKNVPKRSDKDMFLNSQVREMANLPTMSDRESLQKHYYSMLIHSSKEVAISYVSSTQSSGSRFLKQLKIKEELVHNELEYADILFKSVQQKNFMFEDKSFEYSFKDVKLSNTRLKTFLTCKRKYYFKYIQHIKGHTIPTDMPQEYEIGNSVHLALKDLYEKKPFYDDANELKKDLYAQLEEKRGESELEHYLIALQKKKLLPFVDAEIERFRSGWRVISCEEYFEVPFCGLILEGQIDRIDKRESDVEVLDYKTGSYKLYNKNNYMQATDFQLEFYYLLAAKLGRVSRCGFYDLKEVSIVPEAFLNEKLDILQSHIKDLLAVESIDTKKCEDETNCLYCEYTILCNRA